MTNMKPKAVVSLVLAWMLLSTCGCSGRSTGRPVTKTPLPPDIAGTWKARENVWKIVLSPDGTVSSAVIPMGEVEVKPNKTTRAEMKDGQFSTFRAGDCIVEYSPDTRELFVSVEMKKIHVVYADNVVDGSSLDRFAGPVSEDGKVWTADWINVFDYGPRFPQDPNDIYAEPVVFDKIEN